ncbi:unannotated protein [freshwater metagenome]|uniref:Unannotated protein n=1 Tax=freshwater metagenome TaxID=449393 RepID=A0A6J7HGA9_9ZZZZ|nr:glycosyltransferase [Actinomycetota bacterium]
MKRLSAILFSFWSKKLSGLILAIRSTRVFDWIESNERVYQLLKSMYRFIHRPMKTLPEMAFEYKLLKAVPQRTIYCDVSGIFDVPFLDGTRRVGKYFAQHLLDMHDSNYRIIPVKWDGNTYIDYRKTQKIFRFFADRRFEWNPNPDDLLFLQTMEAVTQIGQLKFKEIKNKVRVVTFIHDILPIREPSWFTKRMVNTFIDNLDSALENSHLLVVSSKVVEGDLLALTSSTNSQKVIPQIERVNIASVAQRFRVKERSTKVISCADPLVFLMISTIEPRKGYDELVAAATKAILAGANIKFIIVGRLGWVSDSFRAEFARFIQDFSDRVEWHENATDDEISDFVSEADIFLSPTRGEGFGIPVTEALLAGLPSLARDIPVYQELYGHAVALFGKGMDFPDLYTAFIEPEKLQAVATDRFTKFIPSDSLDSFNALMEVFRSQ